MQSFYVKNKKEIEQTLRALASHCQPYPLMVPDRIATELEAVGITDGYIRVGRIPTGAE